MLNPSPVELLGRVADVLVRDVAPVVPAGEAREQLDAAVALLRRIARCLPLLVPTVLADVAELTAVLGDEAGLPGDLPPTLPSLDELIALDLRLRERLAERIDAGDTPIELVASLTERDASLRLSPWER